MPPFIDITRLAVDTRILVETLNHVWAFKVIDPAEAILEVYGTDPNFKDAAPVKGKLLQSYQQGGEGMPNVLVKDWLFQIRFANVVLVGGPVSTARVEGKDWSYEAIE